MAVRGCAVRCGSRKDEGMTSTTFDQRLDRWLVRIQKGRKQLPAPQVRVHSPSLGIDYSHGERERAFHAASIGKLMTATLIAQLADEGKLSLDAPITGLLPAAELAGLFVFDGIDRAGEGTTRQLLSHTSGIADYFEGKPRTFAATIARDRDQLWQPAELLDYTRTHQHPIAAPGATFGYSDTGYILLGRIIEETTGSDFGSHLHERIFTPLGMDRSCLLWRTVPGGAASESGSPADDLQLAPLWLGRDELSRARSLSCDWAGGGIATTVDDLITFQRALHSGQLIPISTVASMAIPQHRFRPGILYGEGMMTLRFSGFSPFLRGFDEPIGHIGVLSTHLFYHRQSDAHVVLNFHSTTEMIRSFRAHILIAQLLRTAG